MKAKTALTLALLVVIRLLNAQYAKLYEFPAGNDVKNPYNTSPIFDGAWVYASTYNGGIKDSGVVYKIRPDGTGFTKLIDCNYKTGTEPNGSFLLSEDTLYGVMINGGTGGGGVLYKISKNGTDFKKIHDFGYFDGVSPRGAPVLYNGRLYGVNSSGGGGGSIGTIYSVKPDGLDYQVIYKFVTATNGRSPFSSIIIVNGYIFGTCFNGGLNNNGSIFSIKTDGTCFKKLFDFSTTEGNSPSGTLVYSKKKLFGITESGALNSRGCVYNIDTTGANYKRLIDFDFTTNGAYPTNGLVMSDSVLFGITNGGGTNNAGIIYKVDTTGKRFKVLLEFNPNKTGNGVTSSLFLSSQTLFGMTKFGGSGNNGNLFKIDTTGTSFKQILDFSPAVNGRNMYGSFKVYNNEFYGMTLGGGTYNYGTIFKIKPDGTGFTKLYDFDSIHGANPYGDLIMVNGIFYGLTNKGGTYDKGVIFKMMPDGSEFTVMGNFDGTNHGASPYGSLVAKGDYLYGMTNLGGTGNLGCIFSIKTDGTLFTGLFSFIATTGTKPYGSLAVKDNFLYGMTSSGAANNFGSLFKFNITNNSLTKIVDFNGTSLKYGSGAKYTTPVISGNKLYALTNLGGTVNEGVVFNIDLSTDTYNYMDMLAYTATGAHPQGSPVIAGKSLYILTNDGGANGSGTILRVDTVGATDAREYNFENGITGGNPYGSLVYYNNELYGVVSTDSKLGFGNFFKYTLTPDIQANNIVNTDSTITWQKGNGTKSIVFIKEGVDVATNPVDRTTYTANAEWPKGSQLSTSGYYCVYSGTNNRVMVRGLKPKTSYSVRIFTFNGDAGNEQYLESTATYNLYSLLSAKHKSVITWSNPSDITYGELLNYPQYPATANVSGSLNYILANGTKLDAGTHTLKVEFFPTDNVNYDSTSRTVILIVSKATPVISWSNPDDIAYGTLLSSTQLNATVGIDGTFVYDPAIGTKLNASISQSLQVTFTPTDGANYNSATKTVSININKATPVITWNNPTDIVYGTLLSVAQLNASVVNILGTMTYTPVLDTKLNAGNDQTLQVSFTPSDATNYNSASKSVTINVNKLDPVITWNNPADIVVGTALSSTQLNAAVNVTGTLLYNKLSGTVLNFGYNQILQVDFTPDDAINYNSATKTVKINVTHTEPILTWNNPADIKYGTALSGNQLNASTNIDGTYNYIPTSGTTLNTGKHLIKVEFTPTDIANYDTASKTVSITVNKADPVITWNNPADINYGSLLGTLQLNATADLAGNFTYNPASGTKLNAGNKQLLQVSFVPTDASNYNTISKSVQINVNKANPVITWNNPADINYGTLLGTNQLNATADVAGSFVYTPATGTKLETGNGITLKADFSPSDTVNYNTANKTVTINVLGSTEITGIADNKVFVFPNPVKDKLQVTSALPISEIRIVDILGNVCKKTSGNLKGFIQMENLAKGVYFIHITIENGSIYTTRVMKE